MSEKQGQGRTFVTGNPSTVVSGSQSDIVFVLWRSRPSLCSSSILVDRETSPFHEVGNVTDVPVRSEISERKCQLGNEDKHTTKETIKFL